MDEAKQQLVIDRLLTRIQGYPARESKYIMMHAPTERLEEVALPGAERPTILPLAGDKQRVARCTWSAAKLVLETMEKLKAGASSILVLLIEKMME